MLTKCPNQNCNSKTFEIVPGKLRGSNFNFWFTQCSICGTAINVMEYLSLGSKLIDIDNKVSKLENSLLSVQQDMQNTNFIDIPSICRN